MHFLQIECKGKVVNNIAKQSFRDKMTFNKIKGARHKEQVAEGKKI